MLFTPLAWAMLTLTLLVAIPGALAAPMAKRAKKPSAKRVTVEVYPAIEGGETEEEWVQTTHVSIEPDRKAGVEAPTSAPIMAAANPIRKFEEVPAEKRAQILKRMQLCEALLKVSGRAYDYRRMTTAQLEKELATLQPGKNTRAQAIVAEQSATEEPLVDPILDPTLGD